MTLGNPKTLLFLSAPIQRFIDPTGDSLAQVLLLGGTARAVSDGAYASTTVASAAPSLIGGGVWPAMPQRAP